MLNHTNHAAVRACHHAQAGVTVVELMAVVAIVSILATIAVPSFVEYRERGLMRAASNEMLSLLENARFEAIQRDRVVTAAFNVVDDEVWCVGVREGAAACDCTQTDRRDATFCALGQWPPLDPNSSDDGETQIRAALRGVTMAEDPDFGGTAFFSFDPKLGTLTDPVRTGGLLMQSPTDSYAFQMRLRLSPLGRADICAREHLGRIMWGYPECEA